MASRATSPLLRMMTARSANTARFNTNNIHRSISSTTALRNTAQALPATKPVGAFRGGIFGFLSGSVLAGAAVYYYILEEYRVSNEMLTEDIYALQAATQRLNTYIVELENKVDQLQEKKKK